MTHSATTPPAPTVRRRRWPLVLALVFALFAVLVALAPGMLGGVIASAAAAGFNEERQGRLELDGVDLGWTGRQALREARLYDPQGVLIASVSADLPSLLDLAGSGGAKLGKIVVRARAELVADDAGVSNLDRALAERPSAPKRKPADDSDSSSADLGDLLRRLELEFEVVVERLSWSDATTRAAGGPFAVDNLKLLVTAKPRQPLKLEVNGALSGAASGALTAQASVAELFAGSQLNPAARFELDAQLESIPSALVDALARQQGVVALALGERFSVRAKGAGALSAGSLELSVTGSDGQLLFTGELADGVLGGRKPAAFELALNPKAEALQRFLGASLPPNVSLAAAGAPSVRVKLDGLRVELERVLEAANSGGDVAAAALGATRAVLSADVNAWRASGDFAPGAGLELGALALRATLEPSGGKAPVRVELNTRVAAALQAQEGADVRLTLACPDAAQALGVMAGGALAPTHLDLELSSLPASLLTALAPAAAESAAKLPKGPVKLATTVELVTGQPAKLSTRAALGSGAQALSANFDANVVDPFGVQTSRAAGALPSLSAKLELAGLALLREFIPAPHSDTLLELLGERLTADLALEPARGSTGISDAAVTAKLGASKLDLDLALALRESRLTIDSARPMALDVRLSQALVDRYTATSLPAGSQLSFADAAPVFKVRAGGVSLPLDAWMGAEGAAPISLGQILRGTSAALRVEVPGLTLSQPAVGGGAAIPIEVQLLALTAALEAGKPARFDLNGAIAGATPSKLALSATSADLGAFVDGLASEAGPPPAAALRLSGDVASLPTALIDALAAQNGLLVDVLGERMDFKLAGAWPSAPGDPLRAEFTSPTASMKVEAGLEGMLLEAAGTGGIQAQLPLSPLFSERIVGKLVPLCVNASKPQGASPVGLSVRDFQLPLDGDLSKLNAVVELELGDIVYDLLPGLSSTLAPLGLSGATKSTARLGKLSLPIRNGVVSYERLPISIGGKELAFKGAFDLSKLEFDLSSDVPLEALGSKVNAELDKLRQYLDPKMLVPVQLKGAWTSPKFRLADDFTKRVLKDAAEKAAQDALKGGLQDLLGGKKKKD